MTGFELRTSGIWSHRSTNWATTTAQKKVQILFRPDSTLNVLYTCVEVGTFLCIQKAMLSNLAESTRIGHFRTN